MKQTPLNDEVRDLFKRRDQLIAELNEVEHQLASRRLMLIRQRTVETAAHDVFRKTERRASCGL